MKKFRLHRAYGDTTTTDFTTLEAAREAYEALSWYERAARYPHDPYVENLETGEERIDLWGEGDSAAEERSAQG